jgi:hypothetical protein
LERVVGCRIMAARRRNSARFRRPWRADSEHAFAANSRRFQGHELPDLASKDLGMSPADLNTSLKVLGMAVGRPWRKQQKLACLAAWVAVAARR